MDDTEGKITAQEAQQRGKKIKEIQQGLKPAHCDSASWSGAGGWEAGEGLPGKVGARRTRL